MTFTTRPELIGTEGMVASTHWLASAAGMAILEEGGNAFDAAVATGLVLHVVEPHLNGLGGDAPILGFDTASGTAWALCGQGPAPATATSAAFAELGLDLVPGTGHLAAVVPGAFGAWMTLLADHGTLPLERVLRFALGYARDGYPLVPQAVDTIAAVQELFREHWTTSAEIYLPGGRVPEPRARFANPALAHTLERLLQHAKAVGGSREGEIEAARAAFYSGFVAEAITAWIAHPVMDSSGDARTGLLGFDDLASWRATYEPPVTAEFAGATVAKTGPWGQGPVLLQQLGMLAHLGLAPAGSAELVHTVVEVAKLAFADREAYYGDPDFVDVPMDALLARDYARRRAGLVAASAADGPRPGAPEGAVPRLPAALTDPRASTFAASPGGVGEPTVDRSGLTRGDTCHLDVADRWGNVVSATPSGGWLQSSPAIPGLGFGLPTRAQMFWLEDGLPNSIAPRKRPRTTLSPGLLLRDGKPYLAFGTPGGDQQDQWTVPFLINHLVHGMDLQASIDAASWHSTHVPSSFYPRTSEPLGLVVESRLGDDTIAELRRRGHAVTVAGPWSLGRISAAGYRADGMLVAAANPRGMQGYAVGR